MAGNRLTGIFNFLQADTEINTWLTENDGVPQTFDANYFATWQQVFANQDYDAKKNMKSTSLTEYDGVEQTSISTFDANYLATLQQVFAYQGFDAKKIIALMIQRNKLRGRALAEVAITYNLNGEDHIFNYDNHRSLAEDFKMLITLFAIRGNNIINLKSMTSVDALINMLIEKYDIDVERRNSMTSIGPKVITVPRIAACFPFLTCDLFHSGAGKAMLTLTEMGIAEGAVSRAILTSYFAACIPSNLITVGNENPHLLFFIPHILIDNIVHQKNGDVTPLNNLFDYYSAAYKCNVTPQASRVKYCEKMGLLSANRSSFVPAIVNAIPGASAIITAARPNDPSLKVVLESLKQLKV